MNSFTAADPEVALVVDAPATRRQAEQARSRSLRAWRRAGADVLALGAALAVALPGDLPVLSVAAAVLCLAAFLAQGQYETVGPRRLGEQLRDAVGVAGAAALLQSLVALAIVGQDAASAPVIRLWAVAAVTLATGRSVLAAVEGRRRRAGLDARRTLIIGAGDIGHMAARRLTARPDLGLQPVGFLDRDPRSHSGALPVLGASWDLERVVDDHEIDAVLVGFSTAPHRVLLSLVRRCWDLGVDVLVVPRLFEAEGTRTAMERVGGLPFVRLTRGPVDGPRLQAKYVVEQIVALAMLIVLAPVMALIALAVLVTSGRPILHRAPRVGAGGRPFEMLKFRTMRSSPDVRGEADADWADEVLRTHGAPEEVPLALTDPYADHTPIGHFLRRTSLDELPQLFNVVRGDMALIGPRPERVHYAERFAPAVYRYPERHRVRPGITGWAQVNGLRGRTSLDERVEWDLFYVENWSPWLDLKIVARTFTAIWRGAGE